MQLDSLVEMGNQMAFKRPKFIAARSVHLCYSLPRTVKAFYNEVIVEKTTNGSYFMVCGWNTGYFGIQQLDDPREKIALFSVWDPHEGDDPDGVPCTDRVVVECPGAGVSVERFGGEGTGGKLWTVFPWEEGDRVKCLVQAEAQGHMTAYTGWILHPRQGDWFKIGTLKTSTNGTLLSNLYSFIEDFRRDKHSVHQTRKAVFCNAWIQDDNCAWQPLCSAEFSASNAEWESKDNIDAGTCCQGFYLSTGGAICSTCNLGSTLQHSVYQNLELPPSF